MIDLHQIFKDLGIQAYVLVTTCFSILVGSSVGEATPKDRFIRSCSGGILALFTAPAIASLIHVTETTVISLITVVITLFGMQIILWVKANFSKLFTALINKYFKTNL